MRLAGATARGEALRPWRGSFDREAARHLLLRAGFGPAPGELERAVETGLEGTLARLLSPAGHDPELLASARALVGTGDLASLQAWWMALMLAGGDPLGERMTLAWHDHFATSNDKVDDVRLMHRQNELLRELALGDFRELLRRIAQDPAMLLWLDGNENRRGRPNENFARELMELFALGLGNYGEGDIREAARAFTGWGTRGRSFHFRAEHHDPGSKRVFGHGGVERGEEVLELVLAHPACPRWIARRLLEEFVSAEPGQAAIEETAVVLVAENWNVGATLRRLLASELFFDPALRRSRIAGPVELAVSTIRALGARVPASKAAESVAEMGQALFRPPSVKGWEGGRRWIDAGTWLARHNALVRLAAAHGRGGGSGIALDLGALCSPALEGAALADRLTDQLLGASAPPRLRQVLADEARRARSRDEALRRTTMLLLTAPEYHLI